MEIIANQIHSDKKLICQGKIELKLMSLISILFLIYFQIKAIRKCQ